MPRLDEWEEYSPDVIRYWLTGGHWLHLVEAAMGSSAGFGPRGGRHDRISIIAIKADLERAADTLPAHWLATAKVYHAMERSPVLDLRRARANSGQTNRAEDSLPEPGDALERCMELMSRSLGWRPDQERIAA